MRGARAQKYRRKAKGALEASGAPYQERHVTRGHHGNLVNDPRSLRGLYLHLKRGHLLLGQQA